MMPKNGKRDDVHTLVAQPEDSWSPILEPEASSQRSSPSRLTSRRERRQPSITPRKFNRFFTPRSHGSLSSYSVRDAFNDITTPVNNRNGTQSSPLRSFSSSTAQEYSPTAFTRDMKRRKLLHTPSPSFEDLGTEKPSFTCQGPLFNDDSLEEHNIIRASCSTYVGENSMRVQRQTIGPKLIAQTRNINQLGARGLNGRLIDLSLGSSRGTQRQRYLYPISDSATNAADFYSGPEDVHLCTSIESSARSIPFCAASCNSNSLVAIGDEEGQVRLLESAKNGSPKFKDVFLSFRPHLNAIIDMCFSGDDSLLATASGDQSAKVIDMTSQKTISILNRHSASLKQVRFQPGAANNSVIATSSRDGSVQIWDLRCKGSGGPVQDIITPPEPTRFNKARSSKNEMSCGCVINSIQGAHRLNLPGDFSRSISSRYGGSWGESHGRIGDVSVTAMAFLPEGREHLLVTASEANASIKLWDVRSVQSSRQKSAIPLSSTAQPQSHNQWRHFGINSLNLNGDGSRLFALCKDNTVYAYSVAHLILGQAPELSKPTSWRRHRQTHSQEGLGPLYGFRHSQLHATSFYVKSAIRLARAGKAEMLAVGSCDGCAILFPTDERYIGCHLNSSDYKRTVVPYQSRTERNIAICPRSGNETPILELGTPLIRGHDKEVGALAWTSDGDLVTVGDDFLIRCWRESHEARKLRSGGEEGGRRWGCGWADVYKSLDDAEYE